MTICIRCHRKLKAPTESGMGPTCSRLSNVVPVPPHEPDLFGYSPAKAAEAACYRLKVRIDGMAAAASMAIKRDFRAARQALGVWA